MFKKKDEINNINENNSLITVKILSMKNGLIEYNDVEFIRITSKDYTLLIMKDYLPVIGEIKGKVEIKSKKDNIQLDNIIAYYIHKHNQFNLFMKET